MKYLKNTKKWQLGCKVLDDHKSILSMWKFLTIGRVLFLFLIFWGEEYPKMNPKIKWYVIF